jgi:hypothetical protein
VLCDLHATHRGSGDLPEGTWKVTTPCIIVRAKLLPPLPARGTSSGAGRHLDESCGFRCVVRQARTFAMIDASLQQG